MEERLDKLEADILGIKTDLVWMLYLIERIDKNTQARSAVSNEPPANAPLDTTGWKIEKF